MTEATTTGRIVIPTGRIYEFKSERIGDDLVWPRTKILNYPVQGFSADLMVIARISFFRRFKAAKINGVIISSVHDSLVADVHESEVQRTAQIMHQSIEDVPENFERIFGCRFNLPLRSEIQYGVNMKEMLDVEL